MLSTGLVFANDTADLDDIELYDIVKVEQCLDQAYDTVPGHARKLEFKIEGDDPFYEFDIESKRMVLFIEQRRGLHHGN